MTRAEVLELCRRGLPGWCDLTIDDVVMEDPKGFSSFTMSVRPTRAVDPPAVLFRRLEGKDNAILDSAGEKAVVTALGEAGIAAQCYYYGADYRLEEFYDGRTLTAEDLNDPSILRGIAEQLHHFHQLRPRQVPAASFFDLLLHKWGPMARRTVVGCRDRFPPRERAMCDDLRAIYSDETQAMVRRLIPSGPLTFSHNDTYHGNIMRLSDGRIRLLDFEFSCMNHKAFDFSNLFAETAMRHKLPDDPGFRIAERTCGRREIEVLVDAYLAAGAGPSGERARLIEAAEQLLPLSHFMYAMAALPLALAPIQKIRLIPYAHQRFARFVQDCG